MAQRRKRIKDYTFEELAGLPELELKFLLSKAVDQEDLNILGQVMRNSKKLHQSEMRELVKEVQKVEKKDTTIEKPFTNVDISAFSFVVKTMITKLHKEWDDLTDAKKEARTQAIILKMKSENK